VRRASVLLATLLGAVLVHAPAWAQAAGEKPGKVNLNWTFWELGILVGLITAGLVGFLVVYYAFGVVARNRKFAVPTPITVGVPVAAPAAPAPAPVAAAAPAAAAPAPAAAPAATAPAAPAAAPAAPAAAPASTGGLPHIDPNNLPDGIDAVTRGRLKKLAVFQERGTEPPAELLESLKPVLATMGGGAAPAAAPAPAAAAPAPAPAVAPADAPAEPAAEAPAPAAEAPAPAPAAPAPEPAATPAPAASAPAASTGGLPHVDLNNLPAGIDAVTRGRLKKLAVLQERGQEPPAELVEQLKPVLDQMS
jgi:hypothetical protein